jgi:hypothetical protein
MRGWTLLGVVALGGCAAGPLPSLPASGAARSAEELLVPSGFGSLRQEEITLTVDAGDLQLKVTPLEEWVIRLTAPDTWSRLSALAATSREDVLRRTGAPAPLFLVSFFSRVPGTTFRPDDVELVNRGRRLRPLVIRAVTAGWGTERLQQEEAQLAVYAFPTEIDLEQSLTVEYESATGSGWDGILRLLEAERGRARGRAGLGSPPR